MGTTVATNALLERQGAKTVFFVTKGFKVRSDSKFCCCMFPDTICRIC